MACNIRLAAIRVGRTILLNQQRNIIRYTASTNSIPTIRIANFQTSTNLHKSKRSFASEPAPDTNDDVPVIRTKGKGAKGLKVGGKHVEEEIKTSTSNQDLPGEKFNDQQLKETMQRYVKRCKETITRLVSSHGRADPSILDHVQVSIPNINPTPGPTKSRTEEGPSSSIHDFATIGARDGSLIVTCFDISTVKYVERAIHMANLGLTPQKLSTNEEDEAILRIPIPRPTMESRTKLLKDVHESCENSKTGIRNARHIAQKAIKSDEKRKMISADEGRSEMKKVDEETKKHSSEVDKLHEQMKAKIEQQ